VKLKTLSVLTLSTLFLIGCDVSMKNTKKNPTTENKSNNIKHVAQEDIKIEPFNEKDIQIEESQQTKQAESWQNMNLATSTNDGGDSIKLNTETPQNLKKSSDEDHEIQEYFPDFK